MHSTFLNFLLLNLKSLYVLKIRYTNRRKRIQLHSVII
nr:MAG TPA: hypothetical protein [Caudoviricetes sp.]